MANIKPVAGQIPLLKVNVLPQVRITFKPEETLELANDIAANGLIEPPIVAMLNIVSMQKHLDFVNKLKNLALKLSDLKSVTVDDQTFYYYLLAGERRYRAHMILYYEGCTKCRESGKDQHQCYHQHIDQKERIDVRLCVGISPLKAKSIQFRENNHRRPPLHEEAYAYAEMFECLNMDGQKYSLKRFAQYVGVGAEKVRRALNYIELPDEIRMLTESNLISMSHALELKRLIDLDNKSDYLVRRQIEYLLLTPRVRLQEFHTRITQIIEGLNPQIS